MIDSTQIREQPKSIRTGIAGLDALLSDVGFAEFYGEWDGVSLIAHRFIAENGCDVVLTQEFGGINSYLLDKICKNIGKTPTFRVMRAFGLESTFEAIKEAANSASDVVAVVDPFHFAPKKWFMYSDLTKIVAAIRGLAQNRLVAVFNRVTQFGKILPEGGLFHHSSVPAIVRVEKERLGFAVQLMKHPSLSVKRVTLNYAQVYGVDKRWEDQRLLSEWF